MRTPLLFCLLACLAAGAAEGQVITGQIVGTVKDLSGAVLPGAAVTVSSPALLGGNATAATTPNGRFRFRELPPGLYAIEIAASGFEPYLEERLRVWVGSTVERRVSLALAGVAEEVTVTGSLLDTEKVGTSTNYGVEYIDNLPLLRLGIRDFVKMAPGISATRPTHFGNAGSAFGSGVDENLHLIDGADLGRFSELDPGVIEEVEVLGVGVSAEYGNVPGGVFNVVTRAGGEDWRFAAAYYNQSTSLTSDPIQLDCRCPDGQTGFERNDYDEITTQAGGPLLADRLWFYGGFRYVRSESSGPGGDPRGRAANTSRQFFAKLSWQITPRLKLVTSFHDERYRIPWSATPDIPFETGVTFSGHRPAVMFANLSYAVSDRTFLELRVSGMFSQDDTIPNSGYSEPFRFDFSTGVASGGSFMFGGFGDTQIPVSAKVTHYAEDFLGGDHDFKFGLQYKHVSYWQVYGSRVKPFLS